MGGILGGGKGGGGSEIIPLQSASARSPAFDVNSRINGTSLTTDVLRRMTPFQQANDASFDRLINTDLPQLRKDNAFGASLFRTAALDQLASGERRAKSNLINQQELRSTRGSSFAADDLSRTINQFSQSRANTEAAVAQQELTALGNLYSMEQKFIVAQTARELQEAGLGQAQAQTLASLNQQAQIANAQINQQNQAGKGSLLGSLFSTGIGAFGAGGMFGSEGSGAFANLFGGGGGGASVPWINPDTNRIWNSAPGSFGQFNQFGGSA